MKYRGEKNKKWYKTEDEYIDIPDVQLRINKNQTKEYKASKSLIGISLFMLAISSYSLYKTLTSESFSNSSYILIAILLAFVFLSILSLYKAYKDMPIFKLSELGIEYKQTMFAWAELTDLYIKCQHDGDEFNYDIIIQTRHWKETIISINHLDSDIDNIKSDLGMYYWNWKIAQEENTQPNK
ncbi:hypothetical protein [Carboxylicivirga marina]|uniref:hypothetical protein n=1 Tax=Carboxylicivirga marina TaxID=2800988 RepID=UPI0025990946|nr:hypothetical protein [uncultured Carboxylicivirga sp.]